jgi:hypothetical protein
VPQERYIGGLSPVGLPYLSPLTLSLVRPITYFNEISRDMLHGQRATTKLVPRQRRFIYRVSALAFWTTYLILSIARRALRALSHRKFTLHFLTKNINASSALRFALPRPPSGCCADILFPHPHLPLHVWARTKRCRRPDGNSTSKYGCYVPPKCPRHFRTFGG